MPLLPIEPLSLHMLGPGPWSCHLDHCQEFASGSQKAVPTHAMIPVVVTVVRFPVDFQSIYRHHLYAVVLGELMDLRERI